MLGYDYEIRYKPGRENNAADALSRIADSPSLDALFSSDTSLWDSLRLAATTHPYLIRIGKLATDDPGKPYLWRAGLILYKNRVVIPPDSDLIVQLLQEFHDSPSGGHSGVLRTYKM